MLALTHVPRVGARVQIVRRVVGALQPVAVAGMASLVKRRVALLNSAGRGAECGHTRAFCGRELGSASDLVARPLVIISKGLAQVVWLLLSNLSQHARQFEQLLIVGIVIEPAFDGDSVARLQ